MVPLMIALAFALLAQVAAPPDHADHAGHAGEAGKAGKKAGSSLKVLVMDLAAEEGVDAGTVNTLTGIISAEMSDYRAIDVVANADVRRMMELEGEKQAVGCGDNSCLADIAGAMGARLVVFGSAGKLGQTLVVHLNLYDSQKAQSVGRQFVEATDMSMLSALLRPKIRALLERTYAEEGLALPPPEPVGVASEGPSIVPVIVTGAGGVVFVAGSVSLVVGAIPWFDYQGHLRTFNEAKGNGDARSASVERAAADVDAGAWNSFGKAATVVGAIGVGVGVVAVGSGATLLLVSGDE